MHYTLNALRTEALKHYKKTECNTYWSSTTERHMCTARGKHYELEHHTLNANIPNALCTECEARDMHMCTAREIPRE